MKIKVKSNERAGIWSVTKTQSTTLTDKRRLSFRSRSLNTEKEQDTLLPNKRKEIIAERYDASLCVFKARNLVAELRCRKNNTHDFRKSICL